MAEFDEVSEVTRIVTPDMGELERVAKTALGPERLSEFVGRQVVRSRLQFVLDAARGRAVAPNHVLLAGSPGPGKTILAMIITTEVGTSSRLTSGSAIQCTGNPTVVLSGLQKDDVLFIDETHRLTRIAEEVLYLAMEDFRVDIAVGKGPGATLIPLALPPFAVAGATTRSGLFPAPLRDRFGFTAHLELYTTSELEPVVTRSAGLLGTPLDAKAAHEIVSRSRGTPRIANRLLRRVVDYAQVRGSGVLNLRATQGALELFEIDRSGLDRLDRAVLEAICRRLASGPTGLTTLAVTIGEEAETVETVIEPYLVHEGFLARTS